MQREQPGWWQHMSRIHRHATPAQLLAWWEAEDRVRPDWTAQTLTGITAPTLVIAGDRDDVVPLEQSMLLYRSLPRAALAVVPGVGHGAPTRNPGLFNKIVQEFLSGQDGGTR
jgi:pimeloyl-ACP methyl ester carboxylesterase